MKKSYWLIGIKWGSLATERTETIEQEHLNPFSLRSLWLTPPKTREPSYFSGEIIENRMKI